MDALKESLAKGPKSAKPTAARVPSGQWIRLAGAGLLCDTAGAVRVAGLIVGWIIDRREDRAKRCFHVLTEWDGVGAEPSCARNKVRAVSGSPAGCSWKARCLPAHRGRWKSTGRGLRHVGYHTAALGLTPVTVDLPTDERPDASVAACPPAGDGFWLFVRLDARPQCRLG